MVRFQLPTSPTAIFKPLPSLFLVGSCTECRLLEILINAQPHRQWFLLQPTGPPASRSFLSSYRWFAAYTPFSFCWLVQILTYIFSKQCFHFQISHFPSSSDLSEPLLDHEQDGTNILCCCGGADSRSSCPSCCIH